MCRLFFALFVCATAAWPPPAAAATWTPPVPGQPTHLFALGPDPFARGQHRGVDLDAPLGARVRSACGGRALFAGRVAGTGTVSVRCGPWRVTYAPLERIAVRAGAMVGPGRTLGRLGQAGLHFGIRREGRRFGYVDPLRFLGGQRRAPPPAVPVRLPRRALRPRPSGHPAPPAPGLAPWPVWFGLGLLLTGLAGTGTLRFPVHSTGGAACRASSTSSSSPPTPSSP